MQTMYPGMVNSPITELASAIDDSQTIIEVLNGTALPDAPNIAVIGDGEDSETILYESKTGNVLSDVTREFQGTATARPAGFPVSRLFTAYDLDALINNITLLNNRLDANDNRITVSTSPPTGTPLANSIWYEDLGESPDLGGGGLIIANAALDGSQDIWFAVET